MITSISWATSSPLSETRSGSARRRVALGRRADVLVAVVDHADRLAALQRQQRGMQGEDARVLLLAAEAAAGLRLHHDGELVAHGQGALHRLVDVVRALQRAVDGDAAVLARDGDHRLVLDVQLLLVPDAVRALDHEVGPGHGGRGVARLDGVVRELAIGLERIEDGRQPLGAQAHVALRRVQRRAVGRGQQDARLGLVADLAADRDEDRLVAVDEADDVLARDVLGGDDHDPAPVERVVELHADEPRMWLGGADRGPEPRAGEDEVVGVLRRAGELRGPLAPQRPRAARPPGATPLAGRTRGVVSAGA
jgi:hypothetical protein